MEELLGAQDGGHLCLEAALAAGNAQQVAAGLGGAQRRHPLLCVHLLQCHTVTALNAVKPSSQHAKHTVAFGSLDGRRGSLLQNCYISNGINSLCVTLLCELVQQRQPALQPSPA